ncbi:DEKNAAC103337 [Brettanomyces naardenensis]|uniref:GDT1 family protein n=1 Tax=Brettanomyces naardenensis TaxID=13370 RepID=A0A448YNX8_BRENA|nr:DEKNAAC103337 [Brettanomyces naardenensis]
MKFSRLAVLTALATSSIAVFPKVEIDPSLDGSDLVVIQDAKQDSHGSHTAINNSLHGSKEQERGTKERKPKTEVDSPLHSFLLSISMIIVSEIGDKTFLVAAIMAMRYTKKLVFSAAFAALGLMTVLSGLMGHLLPTLLSRRITQFSAAILFLVFGTKLLKEGLATSKDQGVEGEMNEVEEEISASSINSRAHHAENGIDLDTGIEHLSIDASTSDKVKSVFNYMFSPPWIQTFLMTFLGEWGDRSQIATIALAAGSDYVMVILGGLIGHGLCTGMAVVGGEYLSSKISVRTVLLGGSIAFYIFGVTYLYSAYYDEGD